MLKLIDKISDQNRERKYDFFLKHFSPDSHSSILDIGASEKEYRPTANYLEKRYPYPENITVLGVDRYKEFCKRYPKVKTVNYDGRGFPFKDKAFDICWCNAVIEHVGGRRQQELFLREIARVSNSAFVTTPNKNFIYEPHTKTILLQFLPKKIFNRIVVRLGKPWAQGDYMTLLSRSDIVRLLEKSNIKEYKLIENKLAGFTIDFVIAINF